MARANCNSLIYIGAVLIGDAARHFFASHCDAARHVQLSRIGNSHNACNGAWIGGPRELWAGLSFYLTPLFLRKVYRYTVRAGWSERVNARV